MLGFRFQKSPGKTPKSLGKDPKIPGKDPKPDVSPHLADEAQVKELEPAEQKTLEIIQRTFEAYQMPPEAKKLRDEITALESVLEEKRNGLESGYTDPASGEFRKASSVALRQMVRNQEDGAVRQAAYEGIRTIGGFICQNGFLEIVKLRNRMAKLLGYVDFYDYKVTQAEGFSKAVLFEKLDDLEKKTKPLMQRAIAAVKAKKGEDAFLPYNLSFRRGVGRDVEVGFGAHFARRSLQRLGRFSRENVFFILSSYFVAGAISKLVPRI